MPERGFVLQPTYRIEKQRPVVHLFGKLESGQSFLIRDDRFEPHFFIRRQDEGRARALGAPSPIASDRVDLEGVPLSRVILRQPSDTPRLRDRLTDAGVPCLEADVRFAMRYLIDHGIKTALQIDGDWRAGSGVDRIFENPTIAPASLQPSLSILSIDIETDPYVGRLLSIALCGAGASEVLLLATRDGATPAMARSFDDEAGLVSEFCRRVREIDPDIITGWNVIGFDLHFLAEKALELGIRLDLGRVPGGMRLYNAQRSGNSGHPDQASIPGRVVLDGLRLLRGAFIKMESYALDAVAQEVVGEGKEIHGRDRVKEIIRTFYEDREFFVRYNLKDAQLVLDILDRLNIIPLTIERSLLTGMPLDRVSASIASFDFLYLSELYKLGRVAPSGGGGPSEEESFGGTVLQPRAGLYENVLVFDFKSLYPSLMRTFDIDPMGYLGSGPDYPEGAVVAPNGAAFRRGKGILSGILDELFEHRQRAKERGDKTASQAIKILMNSFYGVLGTPACRFFNPKLAGAITSFGREFLLWSKEVMEARDFHVLYGDTDSLFVASGLEAPAAARARGEELAEELNRELEVYIREKWGVESRLELEFEQLYVRLLFPRSRSGEGGAMKRYVGLGESGEVLFTGMEVVRRDWTELARELQKGLYERFFHERPVEGLLADTVTRLRASRLDEKLVYRKALRKDLSEYTSTTPPHVAAARKMRGRPGRLIDYVITTDGPEPAEERRSPFDYEHYVEKQLRPVAEPVLDLLGLRFERVIGDDKQMELF